MLQLLQCFEHGFTLGPDQVPFVQVEKLLFMIFVLDYFAALFDQSLLA